MNVKQVFLWIDEKCQGPFSLAEVFELWTARKITWGTLYACEGEQDWNPLEQLRPQILAAVAPPPYIPSATTTSKQSWLANEMANMTFGKGVLVVCLGGVIALLALACLAAAFGGGSGAAGAAVASSEWDGSVRQVKDWLEANAHDARSIEYVEWSPVERLRGGYAVRCKFRAKNAFGAYVLHNKLFMLDQNGTVLDMKDY